MENYDDYLAELEELEKDEGAPETGSLYKQSLDIIKEAVKDVLQEILIIIDDKPHLVYIHSMDIKDGKIDFSYSTLSELPKDELIPHIQNAIIQQIEEQKVKPSIFNVFK
ncbi:hypothetical protein [Providencia phage PSTCR6]|nr:hypothetical protein [Providencia phage PSTCR6]